jgi:AcrR family transcriptional regulator
MSARPSAKVVTVELQEAAKNSSRVSRLLEVARAEFMRAGFDAVSLDGVARTAGVSKETIYRYFPDKVALFRAALESLGDDFTRRAESIPSLGAEPASALAQYAKTIRDTAVEGGFLSSVWLAVSIGRALPDFAASIQANNYRRLEPLRDALQGIAAELGFQGEVLLHWAVDFGSLAVEGPRHLMGWPDLSAQDRDALAARIASFFLHGAPAAADAPHAPLAAAVDVPAPQQRPDHIQTLLNTAERHFLARGYLKASLDEIGEEARVGRGTLYRHFGAKAGLFDAAMRAMAQRIAYDNPPPLIAGDDARTALPPFLERAAAALTNADSIALHRAAIEESKRAPDLACALYDILRRPWTDALAAWLGLHMRLNADDAQWCAMQTITLTTLGNRPFTTGIAMGSDARKEAAQRATAILRGGFLEALNEEAAA